MARESLSFDNFSLGDTGRRGPMTYHVGRRKLLASYGHFRGLNVMRYPNGSVGPRPPLTKLSLGSLTMTGTIAYLVWVSQSHSLVLITTAGKVYSSQWDSNGVPGAWQASTGTLAGAKAPRAIAVIGNVIYCVMIGQNGQSIVTAFNPPTISTIAGFPNTSVTAGCMVAFREFLVVGMGSTIQYNSPNDPATWPGNFISLPTGAGNMTGLFTQKDTLVIATETGEWWTVTGFLSNSVASGNEVVKRADVGLTYVGGVMSPSVVADDTTGRVSGAGGSAKQSTIWWPNGPEVGYFTGAQCTSEPMPDFDQVTGFSPTLGLPPNSYTTAGANPGADFTGFATLSEPDSFIMVASRVITLPPPNVGTAKKIMGFVRHSTRGWSRHVLPIGVSATNGREPLVAEGRDGIVYFATSGGGGSANAYRWDARRETVYSGGNTNPLTVDLDGDSGAVVVGTFALPEWWTPDGGEVSVAGVIVDFEYDGDAIPAAVAGGGTPTAVVAFTVTVDALNQTKFDGKTTSQSLSWVPPPQASSRAQSGVGYNPIRRRESFRVGDQGPGTGFRVTLSNMRGIQVYRIVVVADIDNTKKF